MHHQISIKPVLAFATVLLVAFIVNPTHVFQQYIGGIENAEDQIAVAAPVLGKIDQGDA